MLNSCEETLNRRVVGIIIPIGEVDRLNGLKLKWDSNILFDGGRKKDAASGSFAALGFDPARTDRVLRPKHDDALRGLKFAREDFVPDFARFDIPVPEDAVALCGENVRNFFGEGPVFASVAQKYCAHGLRQRS